MKGARKRRLQQLEKGLKKLKVARDMCRTDQEGPFGDFMEELLTMMICELEGKNPQKALTKLWAQRKDKDGTGSAG